MFDVHPLLMTPPHQRVSGTSARLPIPLQQSLRGLLVERISANRPFSLVQIIDTKGGELTFAVLAKSQVDIPKAAIGRGDHILPSREGMCIPECAPQLINIHMEQFGCGLPQN